MVQKVVAVTTGFEVFILVDGVKTIGKLFGKAGNEIKNIAGDVVDAITKIFGW